MAIIVIAKTFVNAPANPFCRPDLRITHTVLPNCPKSLRHYHQDRSTSKWTLASSWSLNRMRIITRLISVLIWSPIVAVITVLSNGFHLPETLSGAFLSTILQLVLGGMTQCPSSSGHSLVNICFTLLSIRFWPSSLDHSLCVASLHLTIS